VTSVKLLRRNFHVGIVKIPVDKAESGLVHSSMGAGRERKSHYCEAWGKKRSLT
jgi:hypothetical protein